MMFPKFLSFLLLVSLHYVHGLHQPELPSFGDYMEYYLNIPLSCSNISDAKNVTNLISKKFADCTTKIVTSSREILGNLKLICENQENYLKCWDQLKDDIVTNCHQSDHLPAVYPSTVKSLCGNDKGNLTITNLSKSIETMTEKDRDDCPEETGIHWLDNCKLSLETMTSADLCERQEALDKCLGKITCVNIEFGRLQKQVYSGGRAYLNCSL